MLVCGLVCKVACFPKPWTVVDWYCTMPNLVIISNRLPVSVKKSHDTFEIYPSSGGLATGLSGYTKRAGTKWVGWPGLPSDGLSEADKLLIARKLKRYRCYPVFLSKKQIDAYYNGYSNGVLWPLFHGLPVRAGNSVANWEAYHNVNALFADKALVLSEPGSTLWVHDYQLLLVPSMLRTARADDHIGFFLHIPFPKPEELLRHTHTRALLAGMLGADLVGFHTTGYVQNFLEACAGAEIGTRTDHQIVLPGRAVQATDFPMGIDYGKFAGATKQRRVQAEYRRLQRKYAGLKVIVTVDRLDPTKGFIERLEAYRQLLTDSPELHGGIVMVMLAVPSRGDIAEYRKLRERVEALVRDINRTFGSPAWRPIEYLHQTIPFEALAALYRRADIAFVAPVRDGMNLVAKEYIAAQTDRKGILVLSETAGAAQELKDAVLVNPARPTTMLRGLTRALNLPAEELYRRTGNMQRHLRKFTVQKWADTFMESLQKPRSFGRVAVRSLSPALTQKITREYRQAGSRLLLLDYDGVLRPFNRDPAAATPSKRTLRLLQKLSEDPKNDVMIISGRSKADLQAWFGDLPLALAAEHGALIRRKGGKNWHHTSSSGLLWHQHILKVFEHYAEQTPGSLVEQKEWALSWHYRAASPYYAQKNLVALRRVLKPLVKEYGLQLLEGNKVLEVRPSDVSKRRAAQEWLIHDHDFLLCIGDDVTDEDMFAVMPPHAYSIKVGRGPTLARFRARGVDEVLGLLSKF